MPIPESPQTREEQYLNAMATGDSSGIPDAPVTREEMYLDAIAKNGGGGGSSGGGVLAVHMILIEDENNAKKGDTKGGDPAPNYRLDKTAGEILTALQSGQIVAVFPETISTSANSFAFFTLVQSWECYEDGGMDGRFSDGEDTYYYTNLTDYPQTNY